MVILKTDIHKELLDIISKHNKIIVFSGAGVSVQSGIQDYKSSGDYWSDLRKNYYEHSEIMSKRMFEKDKQLFFEYFFNFQDKMLGLKPNPNHYFAKDLESLGKLSGIITQNVDGLYNELVNKEKICSIHGDITKFNCIKCNNIISKEDIYFSKKGIPHSSCCDWLIKPRVVLYNENFYEKETEQFLDLFETSDCIIVMGTELDIVDHNNKIANFNGTKVLINKNDVKLFSNQNFGWYDSYTVRPVSWDYKFIGDFTEFIR